MFPFYNPHQAHSFQQISIPNQYYVFPQQTYQFYPNFQQNLQFAQNLFINIPPTSQISNAFKINNQNHQTAQSSPQNTKIFSCNCNNTDCRKQYCICFKNGQICGVKCGCSNCRNKQLDQRNMLLQKRRQSSCNCKKSECAKKYCQCFANGAKCGQSCHCSGCKNC